MNDENNILNYLINSEHYRNSGDITQGANGPPNYTVFPIKPDAASS
jgi:hypothetical protein